jgi:hypothetical protein
MKWLKVYGLPKLPLFLARWAMKLGRPGPTWYKWKAAASGTGVILDEMIRAADDLGYDGQKIGKLAMSRIGEKQGTDLREQLGVKTMKDTVDVVMLANRFFDIEITLTETKDGEYVINADRCPWFGGMGHEPERQALLYREAHHRRPHLPRRLPVPRQGARRRRAAPGRTHATR